MNSKAMATTAASAFLAVGLSSAAMADGHANPNSPCVGQQWDPANLPSSNLSRDFSTANSGPHMNSSLSMGRVSLTTDVKRVELRGQLCDR